MKVKEFLENFRYVAEAPNGVSRLREMVLHLAMTGELTQRAESDTPVEVTYSRNQQHRAKLSQHGELRRQKPLPVVDKGPWELPETWKWCRLGEVTSYGSTEKAEFVDVDQDTWVLELEDIEKETSRLIEKIRARDRRFRSSKNRFKSGSVLYGKLRPYLDKVLVADEDGVCTTEIMPISPFDGVASDYLRWFLKSPFFKSYATDSTHGMNLPRLGTEPARAALFPLASEEEQQRIVAKVDELMVLCDKLEAQQKGWEARFPRLAAALHSRLVDSPTSELLNTILSSGLPTSPDHLRQAVLALAVQGKLLSGSGEYANASWRATDEAAEFADELRGFEFPTTWQIRHLDDRDVSQKIVDCPHSTPKWTTSGKICVRTNQFRPGKLDLADSRYVSDETFTERTQRLVPRADDVLYSREGGILGVACRVPYDTELCLGQRMMLIRPSSEISPPYLELVLNSPMITGIAKSRTTGGAAPRVNMKLIRRYPIPLPRTLAEQNGIVAAVGRFMALIDKLVEQLGHKSSLASQFAESAVAAITGTASEESKPMKAPKTELVTRLEIASRPERPNSDQPLAALLEEEKDGMVAKALWQRSGLAIDAFYQQLKTEMAAGWIVEPEPGQMREVDKD